METFRLPKLTKDQYILLKDLQENEKVMYERDMTYAYGLQILNMVTIETINGEFDDENVYKVNGKRLVVYECEELGIRKTRTQICMTILKEFLTGGFKKSRYTVKNKDDLHERMLRIQTIDQEKRD